MEITANSFSLRGASGLVKVVCDSAFDPPPGTSGYSEAAECDVIAESKGFRVNRKIILDMPDVAAFLDGLREISARGEGRASLKDPAEELSLSFVCEDGAARVDCEMKDAREGNENSARVKYPVEPEYFVALRTELGKRLRPAIRED